MVVSIPQRETRKRVRRTKERSSRRLIRFFGSFSKKSQSSPRLRPASGKAAGAGGGWFSGARAAAAGRAAQIRSNFVQQSQPIGTNPAPRDAAPATKLFRLAGEEGFEPPNAASRALCLTTWRLPNVPFSLILSHVWSDFIEKGADIGNSHLLPCQSCGSREVNSPIIRRMSC